MDNQNLIHSTYKFTNTKIKNIAAECKRILKTNRKASENILEEVKEEPQNISS